MKFQAKCTTLVLVFLFATAGAAVAGDDAGIRFSLLTQSDEVNAGETLLVGAVVANTGTEDQFVIVEGSLAPPEEPVLVPPVSAWERFVYELLEKLTGDCDVLFVPAGETRAARLEIEVHPRMHGRFEVAATARTVRGVARARKSVTVKITAPPSYGGVLVHGRIYELGPCRLLITDDGQVYEPKGPRANEMFRIRDLLRPAPDGVTVLGGILPNTLGCLGVELGVDLFRFDREPGTPVGIEWRHLARGASPRRYGGPDEEIVRRPARLRRIVRALGAQITGAAPNFRREMVAVVTTAGSSLTRLRVTRVVETGGTLVVHYLVVNPGPGCLIPAVFAQPYHLVAIPKHAGPVRFVRHDVKVRCDAPRAGVLEIDESLDLALAPDPVVKKVSADLK